MFDFYKTTLPNGLKIITAPLKSTKAMTLLFLFGAGSRYETAQENGLAHFLEHLCYKGTDKRPTTFDIACQLDEMGASYNAFTGEEYTGFYVSAASEYFEQALDILTDIIWNSKLDPREIEREKGVILEEINMYKDTPQAYVNEVAKKLMYGDTPLGRSVAGEVGTVTKLQRADFIRFRHRFYTPDNLIVAVAGNPLAGKSENWVKMLKDWLAKFNIQQKGSFQSVKITQEKPALSLYHKDTQQAHLILAFHGLKAQDKRMAILKVLNIILGATMSSRLFIEVREKLGLCYYVKSDISENHDIGAWGIASGVELGKIDKAIATMLKVCQEVKEKGVTLQELKKAKQNFKGQMYLALEESFEVADFLADQELYHGEIKSPEKIIQEVENVTLSDIMGLAKEVFQPKNLNLAVIGPYKDEKKFSKLLVIE
jgi:predicted Zn-dependent peptidase